MDENTVNLEELFERAQREAEEKHKEGTVNTVDFCKLLAVMGGTLEAYIQTILNKENRMPDQDMMRAATMVIAGIMIGVGMPAAFGFKKGDMFEFARLLYDNAICGCEYAPEDMEDAI